MWIASVQNCCFQFAKIRIIIESVIIIFVCKKTPSECDLLAHIHFPLHSIRFRTEKRLFLVFLYEICIFFGCKITPSKCNLFARWFFYLFFSVFYSLYSGFIKLHTILSKAVAKIRNNSLLAQKHFIKLPYFIISTPWNFLIFQYSLLELPYFPILSTCIVMILNNGH